MDSTSIDGLLPTDDEIIDIINLVTDLDEVDALDKALPAVRDHIEAIVARATRTPAPSLGEDVVERAVVEQLVEEGRAKKCSLNEYQRAAADDEARAFYRKVIHRYRAALSSMRPVQEEGVGEAPDPDCDYCFGTGSVETGGDEAHTVFSVACICTAPASHPEASGVEELRELSEKATPGPWAVNRHLGMVTGKGGAPVIGWASYELIVKSVNHVREALSRVSGRSDLEGGRPASPATCHSAKPEPQSSLGLDPSGECQAQGEVVWLRRILKRCEELTILEEGETREEAFVALDNIRGLVRTTLANDVPAFLTGDAR